MCKAAVPATHACCRLPAAVCCQHQFCCLDPFAKVVLMVERPQAAMANIPHWVPGRASFRNEMLGCYGAVGSSRGQGRAASRLLLSLKWSQAVTFCYAAAATRARHMGLLPGGLRSAWPE
ncbi:hypothetical protein ABBQ38_013573 [Trebouxia sp. C0009 RCD-2024]